ncbi:MAG: phosphoglucomutase/phosphomannomutase family protein [Ignavibacteria bacterium]|jgi:phosphomannomutase
MCNFPEIKFGTDGWRAVIADTYTFENVKRVSLATARVFKNHKKIQNGIVIGYDTRFLSKEFATTAAEIFGSQNIKVYLTNSFVTTPTVSLLSRDKNLAFGVMITASHNPYMYNGYKLKDEFGGSMNPDEVVKVEDELKKIENITDYKKLDVLLSEKTVEYIDGRDYYIKNLIDKINIDVIKKRNLKVLYDTMYGTGQNTLSEILDIEQLHAEFNPSFGGGAPEPVEKNLSEAKQKIKNGIFDIGIVTDGDADRIAIIDENGKFLDAQKTFALLLKYLHHYKGWNGKVVRGYSTSDVIKRYCEKYGLELETVPIGFKYISKLMITEDVMIGAEESGGIGIKGHLPERDGVFNGLLYLEMLAKTGKSVSQLKKDLEDEFGIYFYKRIDVHTTEKLKQETLSKCKQLKIGDKIGYKNIIEIGNLDGYKYSFENGWIIVRASGTEPLLRFYCETNGSDETQEVLEKTIKSFKL